MSNKLDKESVITELERIWKTAVSNGEYESASHIRDYIKRIK